MLHEFLCLNPNNSGPLYYKQKKYNGSLPTLGVTPNSWTKVINYIAYDSCTSLLV